MNLILFSLLFLFAYLFGYATAYWIDLRANRNRTEAFHETVEDMRELLQELEELGFLTFENQIGLDNEPSISDIKRMLDEMDLPTTDGNATPQTKEGETNG